MAAGRVPRADAQALGIKLSLFSVGLMDDVCPPSTVFASYHHYAGPKDITVYAYNGHEWVEGMMALYKIRAVPVNINYRYVESELKYVCENADLVGLILQREFAPRVAAKIDQRAAKGAQRVGFGHAIRSLTFDRPRPRPWGQD